MKKSREFFGRELPKNYSFYQKSDWNEKHGSAEPTPFQMIILILLVLAPIIYNFLHSKN